ncbi:MAG: hypothetical protein PHX44_01255 [Sulfurimonas sp.]|uniref:hypothetical protein n=1 Tax=Sulfurimonas sp. TaxID=2022749 RepID=UPI00260AD5DE|nr:hypothetical protein [Sulfurimonas sp.]MDD2651660.1 hypothetical protein [Sulfurimonas sp.]MDD3451471.1 hypothetical protein [Sulfurimonas sp.]
MDKTRVDDMLIEMISPKIKEIEEKFSRGEGLTQDDINTLLLKSQYNHINHLDDKLNETVASVKALEGKFNDLRGEFKGLEERMDLKFKLFEEKVEHTIQKALNKNMVTLIMVMGAFLALFKVIDKF